MTSFSSHTVRINANPRSLLFDRTAEARYPGYYGLTKSLADRKVEIACFCHIQNDADMENSDECMKINWKLMKENVKLARAAIVNYSKDEWV